MKLHPIQRKAVVEVDVIQMQHGKHTGIRSAASRESSNVDLLQVRAQQLRRHASSPLIEIPKDNAESGQFFVAENAVLKQTRSLRASLKERRAQVGVEYVDCGIANGDIRTVASSRFAPGNGKIKALGPLNRKPAQNQVAVRSTGIGPRFAENKVHLEVLGKDPGLISIRRPLGPDDFLQCDNVRVHLAQHRSDAVRTDALIEAFAPMNVVRGDADPRKHT